MSHYRLCHVDATGSLSPTTITAGHRKMEKMSRSVRKMNRGLKQIGLRMLWLAPGHTLNPAR